MAIRKCPCWCDCNNKTIDDLICWDCWWNSHDETAKE